MTRKPEDGFVEFGVGPGKDGGSAMVEKKELLPLLVETRSKTVSLSRKWSFYALLLLLALACSLFLGNPSAVQYFAPSQEDISFPDLYEASIADLQAGMDAGRFTSVDLVKAYFARIEEVNLKGPELRAVLELNPSALKQAEGLDRERKWRGKRSALHGIPVLLKDNLATVAEEGMNTTAGSYSLLGSTVPEDAGVVKRLRKAGAVFLGKANLCEFSHFRGANVSFGWSGRGGQTTNAYYPKGNPAGSSSGSGVAASIGLAAVTIGTETDGSITMPSSFNNIVGIKPTVGLTSRAGVIPITEHQDTVGPMARSLADAVLVLSIIAGKDPNDNYTLAQPPKVPDYTRALNPNALKGKRIGLPRRVFLNSSLVTLDPYIHVVFEEALDTLRGLGATVVDPADLPSAEQIWEWKFGRVMFAVDFKVQINKYFDDLLDNPSGVRSLNDLIKFNEAHAELELPDVFDQTSLIRAEGTDGRNETYFQELVKYRELGRSRGIDAAMKEHKLDALVLPGSGASSTPAAVAGYPIVTVPMGFYPDDVTIKPTGPYTVYPAPGVPIGLAFFGTAFSEFELIGMAYAYEQKTKTRLARKAFDAAIPKTQLKDIVKKKSREIYN